MLYSVVHKPAVLAVVVVISLVIVVVITTHRVHVPILQWMHLQ